MTQSSADPSMYGCKSKRCWMLRHADDFAIIAGYEHMD